VYRLYVSQRWKAPRNWIFNFEKALMAHKIQLRLDLDFMQKVLNFLQSNGLSNEGPSLCWRKSRHSM